MAKRAWPAYAELAVLVDHLWGHAAEGHKYGLLPGEEALTQVALLSHMRRRFPFTTFKGRLPVARAAQIRKFSLGEEGKTGADWNLLMFDSAGGRVSFRVQAKRLFASGQFSDLKPEQTKRLIMLSDRQGAIPLFGLYQGPQFQPNVSVCVRPGVNDRMGCVVRDARRVQDASPTTTNQWQAQAALGLPLQCIAACYCFGLGGASGGIAFDPSTHDQLPRPHNAARARSVISVLASQESAPVEPRGLNFLAALGAGVADLPVDLIGEYWDHRQGNLDDLDERGQSLFEGVSYLVVIDLRQPADEPVRSRQGVERV